MSQADAGYPMSAAWKPSSQFEIYLHRTHRRWIFWRTVEWVGLSVAIGCAVAFVLSLILLMRGESALPLVTGCIAIGAACGVVVGWMQRPSVLNTASEIDRQFRLADLLATALSIRQAKTFIADAQDELWSHTVLALAEARTLELARQSLILRRYGSRAWGGISLATATVLTLGILSGNPIITRAGNFSPQPDAVNGIRSSQTTLNSDVQPPQIPLENQPESRDASRMDLHQPSAESSTASGDSMRQSNTDLDNSGAGIGQSDETPQRENLSLGHSDAQSQNVSGQTAEGGGNSARNGNGSATGNFTVANSNAGQHSGDWSSKHAGASSTDGNQHVRSDDISDAYRDLVRDYFKRD